MHYPLILTPDDNGTFLVTAPDFPELTTFGDDEADAVLRGQDALEAVIAHRIAGRELVPAPSPLTRVAKPGQLSGMIAAKIGLYRAMLAQNMRKAELARRLNCHMPQVDRLLDISHMSRLDHVEAALNVRGCKLDVGIVVAA